MMSFHLAILMLFGTCFLTLSAFSQSPDSPLFSFGIITDVQYSDKEQVGLRNYRGTLTTLENTVAVLNQYDLAFTVHLGDLIDENFASYTKPLALLGASKAPVYHVFGNHDYSVADVDKKKVPGLLGNPKGYHAWQRGPIQFVVLNGMDVSMDGHVTGSKGHRKALALLEELGDSGANNAKPWNGGLGERQMRWLGKVLKSGEKKGLKTVLLCHYPVLPENGLQLLNHREVLSLIADFRGVVAYFSGHHHGGNYVVEEGVHHLTFYGMVESPTRELGAVLDVYPDRLILKGIGKQEDRVLVFR